MTSVLSCRSCHERHSECGSLDSQTSDAACCRESAPTRHCVPSQSPRSRPSTNVNNHLNTDKCWVHYSRLQQHRSATCFTKLTYFHTKAQYTPPTPFNCRVELRRRCERTSRQSWPSFQFSAPVTYKLQNCKLGRSRQPTGVYTPPTQLNSTWQDKFSTCSVSKFLTAVVGRRRELVANSIHTTDTDATQLDRWVASAVCIGYKEPHPYFYQNL